MDKSIYKILQNIPVLGNIDEDELKDITKKATFQCYLKNSTIFKEGDESTHFYVLKSGKVQMLKKDGEGNLLQTSVHYPDNFFGEMALVNKLPREMSAMCSENCEVYEFDRNHFKDILYF